MRFTLALIINIILFMKKTYLTLSCLVAAMGLSAQNHFVVSPIELGGAPISLNGEAMSDNQLYVVGQEENSSCPMIWNTETGDVVMLANTELLVDETTGDSYIENWTGYFHAINNNGLAVGYFGAPSAVSHAIACDVNNPEDYTILYEEDEDAGSVAFGVSEDGSTIVGFHFDAAWVTHGCIWTEGGSVRTDLPWPSEEQCGFAIDYASARGISADGSTIMGYVQDNVYGAWVFVCWERQADGSYAVNAQAANTYFEYDYQLGKPYMTFEPTGMSRNGEWVTLRLVEEYDPWDWSFTPMTLAGRLNLKTNALEALPGMEVNVFAAANNGTAVGRVADNEMLDHGVIWYPGEEVLTSFEELHADNEAVSASLTTALSDVTGDGTGVSGVLIDLIDLGDGQYDFQQSSFVADIPAAEEPVGIKQVASVADGKAYDLLGRRVFNAVGHLTVVNGTKRIAR